MARANDPTVTGWKGPIAWQARFARHPRQVSDRMASPLQFCGSQVRSRDRVAPPVVVSLVPGSRAIRQVFRWAYNSR